MKELNINGAVVQAYPLTAAQRIHFYTVNACHRYELLNIGTGFFLEYSDVDFDTLKECIYDGYEKFECMRLRFCADEDGTFMQYLVPTEDRDIRFFDFSTWKEEDAHDEMERWTHIPFKLENSPLSEIVMVRLPDGYTGLYMKVHHMILDSSGITQFYGYVLQLYCAKKFEETDPPKPPMSYLKQLLIDLEYENNSPQLQKDMDYWHEQLQKPEPLYTPFSTRNRLLEQRSGGTRIHFWPLRTDIKPKTTFMDALRIVQARENELLRHANYDPIRYLGEIKNRYKAPQGSNYECTTLTYQPMSLGNMKNVKLPEIGYKSRWYSNGVAMQHIYVTVMSVNFEYQKNEVAEKELEELYYYLCRVIFRGIEDPTRTIGEILDWI